MTDIVLDASALLALAIRENAVVWTADRQWLHLGDQVGCQIRMIR